MIELVEDRAECTLEVLLIVFASKSSSLISSPSLGSREYSHSE
jgi:hypothetical protein